VRKGRKTIPEKTKGMAVCPNERETLRRSSDYGSLGKRNTGGKVYQGRGTRRGFPGREPLSVSTGGKPPEIGSRNGTSM